MPYKDKEQQKVAIRKAVAKHRGVIPDVIPSEGWRTVEAYISREGPAMPNLERLQRIAGSLGKYAGDVWFGLSGLTMRDIGEVIGTQPARYSV
jgi:hypothetical protein